MIRPSCTIGLMNRLPVIRLKDVVFMIVLTAIAGCSDRADRSSVSADTLTQRQRDSVVARSKLPGAKAVQGALDAAGAIEARQSAADSIR